MDNASFSAPLDAAVGNTQTSGEEKPSLSHLPPPPPPDWTVIECQDNGTGFDLGGWLAIKDNRFLCEMSGRIYIIALAEDGDVYRGKPERASWCLSTASSSELKSPVSFMGLYDDCIMSTYAVSTLTPCTRLMFRMLTCPRYWAGTQQSMMGKIFSLLGGSFRPRRSAPLASRQRLRGPQPCGSLGLPLPNRHATWQSL